MQKKNSSLKLISGLKAALKKMLCQLHNPNPNKNQRCMKQPSDIEIFFLRETAERCWVSFRCEFHFKEIFEMVFVRKDNLKTKFFNESSCAMSSAV